MSVLRKNKYFGNGEIVKNFLSKIIILSAIYLANKPEKVIRDNSYLYQHCSKVYLLNKTIFSLQSRRFKLLIQKSEPKADEHQPIITNFSIFYGLTTGRIY